MKEYKTLFISDFKDEGGANIWKNNLREHMKLEEIRPKFFGLNMLKINEIKKIFHKKIFHFYTINISIIPIFFLAKLFKKKIIFTLHGNFFEEEKDKKFLKKIFFKKIYTLFLKNSDVITFPSKFLSQIRVNGITFIIRVHGYQ